MKDIFGVRWGFCSALLGVVFLATSGSSCTDDPKNTTVGSAGAGGAGGSETGGVGGHLGQTSSSGGSGKFCNLGAVQSCYSGPPDTVGIGACKSGLAICLPSGDAFGPCKDQVTPQFEDCQSPIDEDCDGNPTCGNVIWAKRFGSSAAQRATRVAIAADGSIVIAGTFAGAIDFGNGSVDSVGSPDVFVTKLSPAGEPLWTNTLRGTGAKSANDVVVDTTGRVYVAGEFDGEIDLGSSKLTSAGLQDVFVASFDSSGNLMVCNTYGDSASQTSPRLAIGSDDALMLLVTSDGSMDFGGGMVMSAGGRDVFLARFGSSGTHEWTKRFGDSQDQIGTGIAVDKAGDILLTGIFMGSINLGGAMFTDQGNGDVFVAKLASDGSHSWSKRIGATGVQTSSDITTDAEMNVLLTGTYVGPFEAGGAVLANSGGEDLYVVELNAGGAHMFSQGFGDSANQTFPVIASGSMNRIALAANHYAGGNGFGFGGTSFLQSSGVTDAAFTAFNADWSNRWGFAAGDSALQYGDDAAFDNAGDLVFVGGFGGSMSLGGVLLTSAGDLDAYVVKVKP